MGNDKTAVVINNRIEALIKEWQSNLLENKSGGVNRLVNYRAKNGFKIISDEKLGCAQIWSALADGNFTEGDNLKQTALKDSSAMRLKSLPGSYVLDWINVESGEKDIDKLTALKDKSEKVRREKGINPLYCCFGFVSWPAYRGKESTVYRSPLIMLPVRLVTQGQSPVYIRLSNEDAFVNPAFLNKFRESVNDGFPLPLSGGIGTESIDIAAFDISEYFALVKTYISSLDNELLSFDGENIFIDEFDYSRLCMYKDLVINSERIKSNKLIRALSGDGQIELTAENAPQKYVDGESAQRLRLVLAADKKQYQAVSFAKRKDSYLLQGPPGTGKSQTIVNIICNLLGEGKKVLFVSEKLTALCEVYNKIKAMTFEDGTPCDIYKYCMLADSENESLNLNVNKMKENLREAFDAETVSERDAKNFAAMSAAETKKLNAVRKSCSDYEALMYGRDLGALKMSVYDLLGRISLLGEGECFTLDIPNIEQLDAETLCSYRNAAESLGGSLAKAFNRGGYKNHVWYGYNLTVIPESVVSLVNSSHSAVSQKFTKADNLISNLNERAAGIFRAQKLSVLSLAASSYRDKSLENLLDLSDAELKNRLNALLSEQKRAETYRKYITLADGTVGAFYEDIDTGKAISLLENKEPESVIENEAANIITYRLFSEGWIKNELYDGQRISLLKLALNEYLLAHGEKKEIEERLLKDFDAEFLSYDFEKLLYRFRTELAPYLERTGKEAFLSFKYRKQVLKYCKSNYKPLNSSEILAALNSLKAHSEAVGRTEKAADTLKKFGITYFTEVQLKSFIDEINAFDDYLIKNRILVSQNKEAFAAYLQGKTASAADICNAAELLGVRDYKLTVASVYKAAKAVDELQKESKRLNGLRLQYAHGYDGIRTDWKKAAEHIACVIDTRTFYNSLCVAMDIKGSDVKQTVLTLCEKLWENGTLQAAEEMAFSVENFYDKKFFNANRYAVSSIKFCDTLSWLSDACDIESLRDYVSFISGILEADGTFMGDFADMYAAMERSKYPYSAFADNLERSVLYAYYLSLVCKFKDKQDLFWLRNAVDRREKLAKSEQIGFQLNRRIISGKLNSLIDRNPASKAYRFLNASYVSCRKLFAAEPEKIQTLKPCMMMSCSSVAQLLASDMFRFDTVVFDEASQIATENSIGSILRADSFVIAGDKNQMPVPVYFNDRSSDSKALSDDGESVAIPSVISFAEQTGGVSTVDLETHFRSKHESLIAFSNDVVYGGRLITFPSPHLANENFGLVSERIDESLKPRQEGGVNIVEAERTAELIREHWRRYKVPTEEEITAGSFKSLGVITFGQAQRDAVKKLLAQNVSDRKTAAYLSSNEKVFFIKTIDEVQGNEMDTVIVSLTYGRNAEGKAVNVFPYLDRRELDLGLHKFNVAVTRAKECLKFVYSADVNAMDKKAYTSYLREYLLRLSFIEQGGTSRQFEKGRPESDFIKSVGTFAERIVGKDRVIYAYGINERSYKIPIVVLNKDKTDIALGIMCEKYRDGIALSEKTYVYADFLKNALGWKTFDAYAYEWCVNPTYRNKLLETLNEINGN